MNIKYLILLLFTFLFNNSKAQSVCERQTQLAIDQLTTFLIKNDYVKIQEQINLLQKECPQNELTKRLQILLQIIHKKPSELLINEYVKLDLHNVLIDRYDDAERKNYSEVYSQNKEKYQFFPLKHPIDSLIKSKSIALLNSETYAISKAEKVILHLFSDHIDDFYNMTNLSRKKRDFIEEQYDEELTNSLGGFVISIGTWIPFGKENFYNISPTFGVGYQGSFVNRFIPEFSYKFRLNNADKNLQYYNGNIVQSNPKTSHSLLLSLGYKTYEHSKIIILPKISTGASVIWTGSRGIGTSLDDDGYELENLSFKNIYAWHNAIGVSTYLNLKNRKYLGLDLNYNYIAYNSNNLLVSKVESNYLSLEVSIKF